MVAALYPWTTDDGVRIAASVGKAVLKHAKLELPQINTSDLVNRMSADVFVFDDLERCRMKVTETFGYINQLVERDGCKVVVLANEIELAQEEGYARGKEKLVGKTLIVEPDFDAAFSVFLSGIDDPPTREFFSVNVDLVRAVHQQSGLGNLRILQQTMWDFERVFPVIEAEHRRDERAMAHLLRLFFALSLELKGGTLNAHDVADRTKRALSDAVAKSDSPRPFAKAAAKYPGLYFHDSILSDEVAYNVLVRGVVDGPAIMRSLNESSWFVSVNEPSWRVLWHAGERRDEDVAAAAETLKDEFFARAYTVTGEMLHVFGQMLWLADLGVSGRTRAETVAECILYVEDLRRDSRLEAPFRSPLESLRHASYGGLGFSQFDTTEFKGLWRYVDEQRTAAAHDRHAAEAERLVALLEEDVGAFASEITHGRGGAAPLAYVPVFSAIDAEDVAKRLVALDPLAYREALLGLSSRWDMGMLATQLSDEHGWAASLLSTLEHIADVSDPFTGDRLRNIARWTIGRRLDDLRETAAQASGIDADQTENQDAVEDRPPDV